jgi:hypothetical protein
MHRQRSWVYFRKRSRDSRRGELRIVPSSAIPDNVKRLLAERIDSVPELEAVLLLREHPEHAWTPTEAGQRLYVSTTVAAHVLAKLEKHGFISGSETGYRYAPSDELGKDVDKLADTYAHHLVEVTRMIHTKPAASVRQFADAFRFRKEK